MPDAVEAASLLRAAEEAVAELPTTELVAWMREALRDPKLTDRGLRLGRLVPCETVMQVVPELVGLACEEALHAQVCEVLARLPFDAGAEFVVPEVLKRLSRPSSDYWLVWMLARLMHHLGYHEALHHVVLMTRETVDTDWRMVGEWIEKDLLSIASSEASRPVVSFLQCGERAMDRSGG